MMHRLAGNGTVKWLGAEISREIVIAQKGQLLPRMLSLQFVQHFTAKIYTGDSNIRDHAKNFIKLKPGSAAEVKQPLRVR